LNGRGPEGLQRHQELLAAWHQEREELQAKVGRAGGELGVQERLRTMDRAAVARALPPGSVLVEYVTFRGFDFTAAFRREHFGWRGARTVAPVLAAARPGGVRPGAPGA